MSRLNDNLERLSKKTDATKSMPTLPQFYSDNMAVRLGLTDEQAQDTKQIRAACALAAHWTEE